MMLKIKDFKAPSDSTQNDGAPEHDPVGLQIFEQGHARNQRL
jgi:hypothetical protein